MLIEKIVSGGQTGADRGGLDAAIELGIQHGGFCPAGRKAEDGEIPDQYHLEETKSASFSVRTRRNIEIADATLIIADGGTKGGTSLTIEYARKIKKPHLVVVLINESDADMQTIVGRVQNWLIASNVKILNVAGSRESKSPGIQNRTREFLKMVLM